MSKPFMFHFTAKLYTIFLFTKLFPKLFLEKSKKFRHESKNFRFYVIKHIFMTQEQKKLRKREDFRS